MLKNTGIATILGLALMAGCAGGTGSQSQDLATGDFDKSSERCYHTSDDYDGSDLVPPPITISIGESLISAPDAMEAARTDEREGYGRLLAEYVTAQVSIDGGAEINSDDIDSLMQAEDMLVHLDGDTGIRDAFEFEYELADLIAALDEMNQGFRIEVPCMDADNAGVFEEAAPEEYRRLDIPTIVDVFEVEAPEEYRRLDIPTIVDVFEEAAPEEYRRLDIPTIVGATAEDSANSADDSVPGTHRPRPKRHTRRITASRDQFFR